MVSRWPLWTYVFKTHSMDYPSAQLPQFLKKNYTGYLAKF